MDFFNRPRMISSSPLPPCWLVRAGSCRSWGKNSDARTMGPATSWGKKATKRKKSTGLATGSRRRR